MPRQARTRKGQRRRCTILALAQAGIGEGALLPHEILIEDGTDPERVADEVVDVSVLPSPLS